jgi:23S rRNA pseudouridine2604 synthase
VQEGVNTFRIVLIQGLNRQIRRMCEHFGYEVHKLERVRIMNISLKGLPVGDWRDLTESEMNVIYSLLKDSSGVDEKKSNPKRPVEKGKATISKTSGPQKSIPGLSSNKNNGRTGRNNDDNRNKKSKPARRSGRR